MHSNIFINEGESHLNQEGNQARACRLKWKSNANQPKVLKSWSSKDSLTKLTEDQSCTRVGWTRGSGRVKILPEFGGSVTRGQLCRGCIRNFNSLFCCSKDTIYSKVCAQFCFKSDLTGILTSWPGELPGSIEQPNEQDYLNKALEFASIYEGWGFGWDEKTSGYQVQNYCRLEPTIKIHSNTTKIIWGGIIVELFGIKLRKTIKNYNIYVYYEKFGTHSVIAYGALQSFLITPHYQSFLITSTLYINLFGNSW